jgi:hypothetical protein
MYFDDFSLQKRDEISLDEGIGLILKIEFYFPFFKH